MSSVRDAMVPDPRVLEAGATAQEAAALLVLPDVRAVLVVEGRRLLGTVTARGLLERVVAAGLDPRTAVVGSLVEPVVASVAPDLPLAEAYALMEDRDLERVAVTEDGLLVGTLSRSAVGRRLAEDAAPGEPVEEGR
jgi:CBS domain-containing protein